MDWSNPVTYIAIMGGLSILVGIGTWIGRMEYFRGSVEDALKDIRTDIGKIFDLFLDSGVASSKNPINLNDLGKTVSDELDAPQWAEQKAATLVETLRDKPPYEIQEYCFQFAANGDNYDPAMIPKMQMNAYNHGLIEEHVRKVFGIVLRDAVLAKLGLQAPDEPSDHS